MKRTIFTLTIMLTLAVSVVTNTFANKPSEAERFEVFIQNEGFRKKLGVTDEQIEKLKAVIDNSYFPHGREGKTSGDPPAEKAFRMDDEFLKEVYKILTSEQKKQVQTYKFQMWDGLETSTIYATKFEILGLSQEQLEKLRAFEVERTAKYHEILKPLGMDMRSQEAKDLAGEKEKEKEVKKRSPEDMKAAFEKIKEPFAKIAKEYNEKMLEVLTPEQLELGKKLTEEGKELRKEVGLPEHKG
jgi:Spy/CpxP family protein refolding chaperone